MNTRLFLAGALLVSSNCLPLTISAATAERAARRSEDRVSENSGRDYLLQPQDVLRVHVFQHDDLNKQIESVSISQDFTIYLPLVQTINVRGKTVRQAEDMIRAAYDKDYLVNPQVSINVLKYAERSVNIMGQVNTPGRIPFPPERGLTILEAISAAGGPTRLADLKKVRLTRKGLDGDTTTEEINVDAMTKGTGRDAGRGATILQKDDTLVIPERIL